MSIGRPAISWSILIADDDEAFRLTVRDILEPVGFRTFLAPDGQEALQVIRGQAVDCLLLDVHMPRLTGLEMLRALRDARDDVRLTPAIFMTADANADIRQQAARLQAFTVLKKPMSKTHLTESVQQAIQAGPRPA